eukprot:2314858-Pyramimonas_sp.AAC.1
MHVKLPAAACIHLVAANAHSLVDKQSCVSGRGVIQNVVAVDSSGLIRHLRDKAHASLFPAAFASAFQ